MKQIKSYWFWNAKVAASLDEMQCRHQTDFMSNRDDYRIFDVFLTLESLTRKHTKAQEISSLRD